MEKQTCRSLHFYGLRHEAAYMDDAAFKWLCNRISNLLLKEGCCFIKYATSEEADQAIRALHNQHTLPGGAGPIQVRYADGERERLGAVEYKLFVGSLNKKALVKEVEEVFSKYGRVEDVYLMRDDKKQSRGCGFVKYSHRDMALAATNGLNGIYTMRGCDQPLIVRFGDPKRPRQGDSSGPAFGAAGFGPRLDAPGTRFPSNNSDPMGDRMPPPNAWRPTHQPNTGTSFNAGFHGMGPPLMPRSGDMTLPISAGGPMTGMGASIDVRFQAQSPSAMPQQNFNQPRPQIPPVNQQMPPPQKPIQSSQEFPPSHQLYPQALMPYSQTSTLPSLRQHVQPQPLSAGPQGLGISAQFSAPQPQAKQSVLSAMFPQTSLDTSIQSNTTLTTPSRQQIPPSMQRANMSRRTTFGSDHGGSLRGSDDPAIRDVQIGNILPRTSFSPASAHPLAVTSSSPFLMIIIF